MKMSFLYYDLHYADVIMLDIKAKIINKNNVISYGVC